MASHRIGAAQYLGRSSDEGDPRHLNTTFLAMKRPNPLIRAVDVDLELSRKTVPVWLVRPPFGTLFGLRQTRDLVQCELSCMGSFRKATVRLPPTSELVCDERPYGVDSPSAVGKGDRAIGCGAATAWILKTPLAVRIGACRDRSAPGRASRSRRVPLRRAPKARAASGSGGRRAPPAKKDG
jgi:hypothetical protein